MCWSTAECSWLCVDGYNLPSGLERLQTLASLKAEWKCLKASGHDLDCLKISPNLRWTSFARIKLGSWYRTFWKALRALQMKTNSSGKHFMGTNKQTPSTKQHFNCMMLGEVHWMSDKNLGGSQLSLDYKLICHKGPNHNVKWGQFGGSEWE